LKGESKEEGRGERRVEVGRAKTAHYPIIGSLSELDDVLGDLGTGGKGHALARP